MHLEAAVSLPDLYVLRHGETEWNRAGRWQGVQDSPLTELGLAQARAQGDLLRALALTSRTTRLVSSPQGRARHTAEIVAEVAGWDGPIHEDDRLVEIDVGDWTGLTRDEMRATVDLQPGTGFLALYAMAPSGETFDALRGRSERFLADLSGPTVTVTHGITSRFLRAAALGLDLHGTEDLPGGQGVIHRVARGTHSTLAPEDGPA